LLPEELAAQVIAHETIEPPVAEGAPLAVTVRARPAAAGGFCERRTYYVSVYARVIVRPTMLAPMFRQHSPSY